jgi:ABC-type transport system involved in cytochrome c biogenesis permease subunit
VYIYRREEKSSSFPQIAGVHWSSTVESTLWGMVPGMAVVLGVILGPAEIAPAS